MAERKRRVVEVNRAPVMTLWATVVAQRLGHDRDLALTLGKAVAGLNAHSKARRLGLVDADESKNKSQADEAVPLLGRSVPVVETDAGLRAAAGDKPVTPASVEGYLKRSFGDNLAKVEAAMQKLAASRKPKDLGDKAYALYEQFRPGVPAGQKGWGVKGKLDLTAIEALAREKGE